MSFIHPERYMTDTEGHSLIACRNQDSFHQKPVWAVYKVRVGSSTVETRICDFVDLATAKATADALNLDRDKIYYFRVLRLKQRN
jgi:hypothetical protein